MIFENDTFNINIVSFLMSVCCINQCCNYIINLFPRKLFTKARLAYLKKSGEQSINEFLSKL